MKRWINIQYSQEGSGASDVLCLQTPLFLIGFMGVGKSSIATRLGQLLRVPVHEMDEYIEVLVGMRIPEIFRQRGEDYFRGVESAALAELGNMGPRVISCGGGVPMRAANVSNMRASGKTLLLTAQPETIFQRVRKGNNRPLLNGNMNLPYITQLMEQRRERYEAAADTQVCTDGKTVEEICQEIVTLLGLEKTV